MFLGDITILITLITLRSHEITIFCGSINMFVWFGCIGIFGKSPEIRDSFAIRTRRLFLAGYRKYGGGS